MSLIDDFTIGVYVYGVTPTTTTADGFVIGETTRGRLGAAAANKLRSTNTNAPTDIVSLVESVEINRGRRRALDSFDGGSCTIVIESTTRDFDQAYTSGSYSIALAAGGRKQLFRRGRAVRVVASGSAGGTPGGPVSFALFSGWIDAINTDYQPTEAGVVQRTTISCVDAFGLAGRVDRDEADMPYGAGETMGPRVRRWAESAGLMLEQTSPLGSRSATFYRPAGNERPTDMSSSYRYGVMGDEGSYALQSTTLSENALTAMKAAAASEDALLYVNGDGQIVHQARATLPGGAFRPVWAANAPRFSDSNTGTSLAVTLGSGCTLTLTNREIEMEGIPRISTDTTDVATYVSLARAGGTARVKVDSDTVDVVGRVAFSRTDLINNNDADVDTIAAAILARHASEAKTIVSDVRTRPWHSDAALAAAMLLELTQPVYFQHTLVCPTQKTLYVQGISHSIQPNKDWTTTYTLSEVL